MAERERKQGNGYFRAGQYREAVDCYTRGLTDSPDDVLLYSNRSLCYVKLKMFDKALEDASKCVEVRPQWVKGYLRKVASLEALEKHEEVMEAATKGFKVSHDQKASEELVRYWFRANQVLNGLPEGSVDLPSGIHILSKEYMTVLVHLIRSLNGEVPLTQSLMEQCLFSCAEQIESILYIFGEPVSDCIKPWCESISQEIFPYNPGPVQLSVARQSSAKHSKAFVEFIEKDVNPALYMLIRPILGLVVLVVLNRTNVLSESNTGHQTAELMNTSLLPLFEKSILGSDDKYRGMYIGRLCAILDSYIGRGYKLSPPDITTVTTYVSKVEDALKKYPDSAAEYNKDITTAKEALHNIKFNVLLPAKDAPPPPFTDHGPMTVQIAETVVKESPSSVRSFLKSYRESLQSIKYLSLRDIEDLLTMTGIYLELGEKDSAKLVFQEGEKSFFKVFGHLLSTHAILLDQCPATIAPMRQLVLSQASLLNDSCLFADVLVRWKCLFSELRRMLIHRGLGLSYQEIFQWYINDSTSAAPSTSELEAVVHKHLQNEKNVLSNCGSSSLENLAQSSYKSVLTALEDGDIVLDYIFFATTRDNQLLEGCCVVLEREKCPRIFNLDFASIRKTSTSVLSSLKMFHCGKDSSIAEARLKLDLSFLSKLLLPVGVCEIISSHHVSRVFVCPDSEIVLLPLDMLPIGEHELPLFKQKFSVTFLSGSRQLLWKEFSSDSKSSSECCVIANPNYDLEAPQETFSLGGLFEALNSYVSLGLFSSQEESACIQSLDHSVNEAKSISLSLESMDLPVRLLSGNDTTVSQVLALRDPLVLHISSHAFSPLAKMAFHDNFWVDLKSTIALAGYNTYARKRYNRIESGAGMGQLPALAVCSMDIKQTKLVFLSTCGSAIGSISAQEPVTGLVEAFHTAGADTVIATHWPIADATAVEFSKHFYSRLKIPGVRPSEALSFAKQQMASADDLFSHFFYWGAFTCYGTDTPIH